MKKLVLFLLLLFAGITNAQLVINTPTPLNVCDTNNDNFESISLNNKKLEILGSLNPANYQVSLHSSLSNAQLYISASLMGTYSVVSTTTIYIRVQEIANPTNFATTSLSIVFFPTPIIANQVPYFVHEDIPFDGHSEFDLTSKSSLILGNQTGCLVTYFASLNDAQNNTNQIINDTNYINVSNPQIIYARITNTTTGCYSTTKFNLVLSNPDIAFIPDVTLKNILLNINTLYQSYSYDPPFAKDINGNTVNIDTNNDGEIQITEARNIYSFQVNKFTSNPLFTDITGFEEFTNLTKLTFVGYNLSALNFSGFVNLTELNCSQSSLTSLNTNTFPNLTKLWCTSNQITSLNTSNNPILVDLNFRYNQITSIDLSNNSNLEKLTCNNNLLTSLDLTPLINLTELIVNNNQITALNTASLSQLTKLNCSSNLITSIDTSNFENLIEMYINSNQIASISLSGLFNLKTFNCSSNQLSSIDLSDLLNLETITCSGNQLSSLDFHGLQYLKNVYCNNNLLTSLDFSDNQLLYESDLSNNHLNYLNVKNGSLLNISYLTLFPIISLNGNPNLLFVCADENERSSFQALLNSLNYTNTQVNSYCTFVPGGNFNTITGNIIHDLYDDGCDASDVPQQFMKIKMNYGNNIASTYTNSLGVYNFYSLAGTYNLVPEIENPSYYNISPTSATVNFADNNNNTATQNFCVTPNGYHDDAEIVITEVNQARPGFDAIYKIVFKNKGNRVSSGSITLSFNDELMDFVSSTNTLESQENGSLSWFYNDLLPFENRSFYVTFNINSPQETPPVNLGSTLTYNLLISNALFDSMPNDNYFTYNQTVVNSMDPNDIECLEGETVSPTEIGNYLHYNVRFENTGTASAENVVIKDIIDTAKYDIDSLQLLNSSDPVYVRITNNIVEFIFENINLSAGSGNPPVGGHGNVLFKIKSKNELAVGDYVQKRANIYFDYNAPIDTNMAQTTFSLLNNSVVNIDQSIIIYPNPTTGIININSNFNIKSIEIYDIQGRILETSFENSSTTLIDISEKQKGIYFLKVTTENGSKIEKIIKE